MISYRQRVAEIERRLGRRRLVFFGTRGMDAQPLLALAPFAEIFSQIAPFDAVSVQETCLETLKKRRVDLDRYSIDLDPSPAVHQLRQGLLRAFSRPAAVLPYRPCAVLASACFTRSNMVEYLGVFHEKQACFEHKPWIETQLAAAGVRVLPWAYYADDDLLLIREAAEIGPLVLRANRSDGGAGLTLIEHPSQLGEQWPAHGDGFLAAAPFLAPSLPLNVNACVFPGGQVTLHAPSVQLIGIPLCTTRRFGYCGNDFAKVAELDPPLLAEIETITVVTGRWLAQQGYLGAFGIDAIVHDGTIYLVEVNPRFQGSSVHAAQLGRELERPDLFLDHIAAFLGLPPPDPMPLADIARRQPPAAHVVVHNNTGRRLSYKPPATRSDELRANLLPRVDIKVDPDATFFDALFPRAVTGDGFTLHGDVEQEIRTMLPAD